MNTTTGKEQRYESVNQDVRFEPKGLSMYDTIRQRFTAYVLRETAEEFICASKYDGGQFVLPKYAWRVTAV